VIDRLLVAARVDVGWYYYVGLAVVVLILIITLISFARTWMEIHEDEEPDAPEDLLDSFREAHAAGQIDDRELDRLTTLLSAGGGEPGGVGRRLRDKGPAAETELPKAAPGTAAPDDPEPRPD
jgi:hypothetical protein